MKRILITVVALVSMAGCASVNTTFVYKPGRPAAGGPKIPVKVAVLPFKDGTEDFTKRGSVFDPESLTFNLAKSGIDGIITAVTPELWAKTFADDMASSGTFRAVRFVYSPSELTDEEFYIEGTLEKAYAAGGWSTPSEYVLGLRALRRSNNRTVWEKKVTRELKARKSDFDGCGTKMQCIVDRSHAAMNQVMQGMFAEAREDFVKTVVHPSGSGIGQEDFPSVPSVAGEAARQGTPKPSATEPVEQTIDRILRAK